MDVRVFPSQRLTLRRARMEASGGGAPERFHGECHTQDGRGRGGAVAGAAARRRGVIESDAARRVWRRREASGAMAAAGLPPCAELPSFEAARALAGSRYSCLVVAPQRRRVALQPRFLRRQRSGICAQLDAQLRRFCHSCQGVPVAYDDIKITNELGDIIDDMGAIHLDIEANFVIFQPKPGKKLVGIINKVAPSHIGCLVHGCFNASIPKPDHVSIDEWKNFGFEIGNKLVFKVVCFDSDAAGVFCIQGKLCRDSIRGEIPKEKRKRKHEKHSVQDAAMVMEVDVLTPEIEDAEMQFSDVDNGISDKSQGEPREDKADLGMHASDSSGYQSDHGKSKKKKRRLIEEEIELIELLKSRAKKKRKE